MSTDKKQGFVRAVADLAASLYDFHERWGFGSFNPRPLRDVFAERYPILDEEVGEFRREIAQEHRRAAGEELADVLFVALGDAEVLGDDAIKAIRIVAGKNRAKTRQTHAVAPSGKLLPLADDKAHKWDGMETARMTAIQDAQCFTAAPTAQVVTKESHPEVRAKLQPPTVPLATLDAWDHAGRRPGEGDSANRAP